VFRIKVIGKDLLINPISLILSDIAKIKIKSAYIFFIFMYLKRIIYVVAFTNYINTLIK